ncbi:MAG TPA: FAD-dependent oxidoreductase [Bacteroidales bacterium]|nr:FAD-dependent oxidoreductase [Bacteroidales bacterium]HRT47302.1 FAD-dependent oxidoreductase [Bacteroidales bacterium]HRU56621.1 FAD-dependent oxidoreductase [Bacteroidales bacterium]
MMGRFLLFWTLIFFASCANQSHNLLVEAESFEDTGGWVVDPQFTEQMGSPYLLAHGLGNPVKNASTRISLPSPGRYYIWVRTRDWAPGKWDAPGRFKISVNGKELKRTLGTGKDTWSWQYAGKVKIKTPVARIELRDLTGFDGRCDAVYLSTIMEPPPEELEELNFWRMRIKGEDPSKAEKLYYDLVVVGGGIAGCAASIAAAEQGLKVALIHDRPVLGGNASSEIRVHTEGITWKADRILRMINTVHWPNGSPESVIDDQKRHENISRYNNISLFLNWRAFYVTTVRDSITSVYARHTSSGEIKQFCAPVYIDCTGDGWIGYWAGADYMYGREDSSLYGENWEKYGELWSPERADNKVMGASLLWRSADAGKPVEFPEVPWAIDIAGSHSATSGTWQWEFSSDTLHQIDDAEYIRDYLLKAIYGSFYNAKKKPENKNLELEWVGYLLGKRESRRLVGDYIYTFRDEKEMREFPDAVAMETRNIDVHYQQKELDPARPAFLSEALYYKVDHYYIPFRSLYSRNIKNLMMAGRCFSCSHVGLGGPRVMHTTGQMGVATGYAASLCLKYNATPREIYINHMEELKKLVWGK